MGGKTKVKTVVETRYVTPGGVYGVREAVAHMDQAANQLNGSLGAVETMAARIRALNGEMDSTVKSGVRACESRMSSVRRTLERAVKSSFREVASKVSAANRSVKAELERTVRTELRNYAKRLSEASAELKSAARRCERVESDVKAILGERMPEFVSFVPPEELRDPSLSDAEFLKRMAKAAKALSTPERMRAFVAVARDLAKTRESFRSKVEKLDERVRLSERMTPEWHVAVRKRQEAETVVRILTMRIALAGRSAFRERAASLRLLKNLTALAYESLPAEPAVRETLAATADCEFLGAMAEMDLKFVKGAR